MCLCLFVCVCVCIQASFLTAQLFVLNGELGTFTQLEFAFEITRAGTVEPRPEGTLQAICVDPYSEPIVGIVLWLLEALWVVMIVILIISEVGEMREFCNERGPKRKCIDAYCKGYWGGSAGLWNLVDWAQVVITVANTAFWAYIIVSTREMMEIVATGESNGTQHLSTAEYASMQHQAEAEYVAVADGISRMIELLATYRILAFVNLYILMMRFFKSFLGQPKLALVTRSFQNVGADFAHWLIVFVCLLVCFTFAGMFWFGQSTLQFSSILFTFTGTCGYCAGGIRISHPFPRGLRCRRQCFHNLFAMQVR